jgi:hypothetical protein
MLIACPWIVEPVPPRTVAASTLTGRELQG